MIWRPTNLCTGARMEARRAGRSFGLSHPPRRRNLPVEDEPPRKRRRRSPRRSRARARSLSLIPHQSYQSNSRTTVTLPVRSHLVLLDGALLTVVEAQQRAGVVLQQSRGGGIGRRPGLKIPCPERGVRVRSPPPAPIDSTRLPISDGRGC